jgi:hypothetical protein
MPTALRMTGKKKRELQRKTENGSKGQGIMRRSLHQQSLVAMAGVELSKMTLDRTQPQ